MWIIMAKGETYYVDHVEANLPWTTKETPNNVRTKGAIKFKDCLVTIDDENCAKLTVLTTADEIRLRNRELGIVRIITQTRSALLNVLRAQKIKHGPLKLITGGCGSHFYVTDILSQEDWTALLMAWSGPKDAFRALMPNEGYYKAYDDPKYVVYDD